MINKGSSEMSGGYSDTKRHGQGPSWRELCERYDNLGADFAALGGALETEDEADAIWARLLELAGAIAAYQVKMSHEIAKKLEIAAALLDEGSEAAIRNLLVSAALDLKTL